MSRLSTLVVLLPLAACAVPVAPGSYVGHTASGAFLAVVTDGTDAAAYRCDGTVEGLGVAEWYEGPGQDGDVLAGEAGSRLTVFGDATGLRADLDGEAVLLAPATGDAGLWRTTLQLGDDVTTAGWIVDLDGAQRGAQRAGTAEPTRTGSLDTSSRTGAVDSFSSPAIQLVAPAPPDPVFTLRRPGVIVDLFGGGLYRAKPGDDVELWIEADQPVTLAWTYLDFDTFWSFLGHFEDLPPGFPIPGGGVDHFTWDTAPHAFSCGDNIEVLYRATWASGTFLYAFQIKFDEVPCS